MPQRFLIRLRHAMRRSRLLQTGLIFGLWLAGTALAGAARLPLPGGVVGLFLALGLLASRRMSVRSLRRGAEWLLADMLLFFVPAVLAVLDHRELMGLLGLRVLGVILASTVAVMGVTGLVVDLCSRLRMRHGDDPRILA